MAIQLFKRANDKTSSKDEGQGKHKWNAGAVYVKIDNEMVPLSELARLAKDNEYVPVQKVENDLEIDGTNRDVNELIDLYRANKRNMTDKEDPALQAAKKGMKKYDSKGNEIAGAVEDNEDENAKDAAKKNEDAGEKELEKGEKEGKEKTVVEKGNKKEKENGSDAGMVKDTDKKQNEDDDDDDDDKKENEDDGDEDVKESIRKQSKDNGKDVRHFIRLNSARENGDAGGGTVIIDTMYNRVDRGINRYGSTEK